MYIHSQKYIIMCVPKELLYSSGYILTNSKPHFAGGTQLVVVIVVYLCMCQP